MSHIGERDDAPEIEDVIDGEERGGDEPGSDEGDADEVGEESDERAESDGEGDAAGEDEGAEREVLLAGQKPRSAATIAVQTAKRDAKEAREKADRLEREMNELRQSRQHAQTAEQTRLEQERVALMAPEEKFEYLLGKQQQETNARYGALEFRMADSADRTAFEGMCARNPAFDAVRDETERALSEMRGKGGNTDRATVATYLIGKRAIDRANGGGKTKQANKGKANIQRQTTKPAAGRSDAPSDGGRRGGNEAAARKARLANQNI